MRLITSKRVTVVVPTIRPDSIERFLSVWASCFLEIDAQIIIVYDGGLPKLKEGKAITRELVILKEEQTLNDLYPKHRELFYNYSAAIRNMGFAYAYKNGADVIITMDDDVVPLPGRNALIEHLKQLERRVPVRWLSTASEYMRGFPYDIRDESPVMLSHGVWQGVPDLDAPTQLTKGDSLAVDFPKTVIPRGVFFPMSSMNLGFTREMTPYVYQAPMGLRIEEELGIKIGRFDDIWAGVAGKIDIDKRGWAAVTGYSSVFHTRASNVWTNLRLESVGLPMNEECWKEGFSSPYWDLFQLRRDQWKKFLEGDK